MLAMLVLNRMSMKRRQASQRKVVKKVEIEKKKDLEYCRTCLNTDELVSIFYNTEATDKRTEELRLATGLEIKQNDGLSQKICAQCIDTIDMVLQFRNMSRKAEKALLNMLTGTTKTRRKPLKMQKALKSPKIQSPPIPDDIKYKKEVEQFQESKESCEEYSYTEYYDDHFYDNWQENSYVAETAESKVTTKPRRGRKRGSGIPTASSYKCSTCSKEFRMKATYKAHMRFHTNYCVCESCGKRCRNHNQLQEHKRARHGLGKIHTCTYCEYSSATKEALTIHERRHTGERPYICDHCGATFHRRSNLVQHIAIHLPDKNFQCPSCPKRLKSQKLLMIHKYKAHRANKWRYLCVVCGDSFSRPGNVRQHMTRSHRVPRHLQGVVPRVEMQQPDILTENYLYIENDINFVPSDKDYTRC